MFLLFFLIPFIFLDYNRLIQLIQFINYSRLKDIVTFRQTFILVN